MVVVAVAVAVVAVAVVAVGVGEIRNFNQEEQDDQPVHDGLTAGLVMPTGRRHGKGNGTGCERVPNRCRTGPEQVPERVPERVPNRFRRGLPAPNPTIPDKVHVQSLQVQINTCWLV